MLSCLLLVACIGDGGTLHRWHDARSRRWNRTLAAQGQGRSTLPAALGPIGRAWLRWFDWAQRLWRRRLLRQGATAPLPARLDLGLGFGGQSVTLAWTLALVTGGTVGALLLAARYNPDVQALRVIDAGRFGLRRRLPSARLVGAAPTAPAERPARLQPAVARATGHGRPGLASAAGRRAGVAEPGRRRRALGPVRAEPRQPGLALARGPLTSTGAA